MKYLKKFNEEMFNVKVKDMHHTPSSLKQLGLDKETEQYTNIGTDEDGNIIGNCKNCGSNGVLINGDPKHIHKCKK